MSTYMAEPKTEQPNPSSPSVSAQPEAADGVRPERYDPSSIEQKWSDRWANDPALYAAEPANSARKKYYVLEMLPYPSGALHMDAGLQRAASHGVGRLWLACGECGDQEQHSAKTMDPAEHCRHEGADESPGLRLRLVHGNNHLLAGLLPLEPVVLPQAAGEGPSLPQARQSELVSRVRHRAGQRAGAPERLLLAPRNHVSRAARAGAVVPAHHRLCRRTVEGAGFAAGLAGARHCTTTALDRPQRGHLRRFQTRWPGCRGGRHDHRVYDARGYDLRCDLVATGARASAGGRSRRR